MFFTKILLVNKIAVVKLILSILFVTFFFATSCTSEKKKVDLPLTNEEVKDLEYFLNLLLFENYGAFVVLGSKPICMMPLFDTERAEILWQQKLASMTEEERNNWDRILKELEQNGISENPKFLRNPYKGWLAWKKINNRLDSARFLLFIRPETAGLSCYDLFFVDIPKVALTLIENYDYFRKISGMEFDPFSILYEFENPESKFWNKIFQMDNHLAKGLLFGYGRKNALLFENQFKHLENESPLSKKIMSINISPSIEKDIKLGQGNLKNFTIPYFRAIDRDEVRKYQEEKKEIEAYYRGKDFLKTTFELLFDQTGDQANRS